MVFGFDVDMKKQVNTKFKTLIPITVNALSEKGIGKAEMIGQLKLHQREPIAKHDKLTLLYQEDMELTV